MILLGKLKRTIKNSRLKEEKTMHRLFVIILLSVLGVSAAFAQKDLNSKFVESKTLSYYYASNWDSLITLGEMAESQGIDYYYLNYRIALAYYFRNNFFTASHYFNKAYNQNKTALLDSYFKEKYFRSLIYSKQNTAAHKLLDVVDTLSTLIDLKYKGNLYFTDLYGNANPLINEKKLRGNNNNILSQTNYLETINIFGLAYSGLAGENLWIDFGYSYAKLQMIAAVENQEVFQIRSYSVHQNAINIKPTFWLNRTNSIALAGGFSAVSGQPYGVVDSTDMSFGYSNLEEKSFMGGIQYEHIYKNLTWGLSGAISNFEYGERQLQAGVSLNWFPKGNLDLYTNTQAHIFSNAPGSFRPIIYQKLGFKVSRSLWFEATGIYGDVKDFTLLSNNFSYEIPTHTHGIAGGKFIFVINENINLILEAQYLWKFTRQEELNLDKQEYIQVINYQQTNFLGGLQWKF